MEKVTASLKRQPEMPTSFAVADVEDELTSPFPADKKNRKRSRSSSSLTTTTTTTTSTLTSRVI